MRPRPSFISRYLANLSLSHCHIITLTPSTRRRALHTRILPSQSTTRHCIPASFPSGRACTSPSCLLVYLRPQGYHHVSRICRVTVPKSKSKSTFSSILANCPTFPLFRIHVPHLCIKHQARTCTYSDSSIGTALIRYQAAGTQSRQVYIVIGTQPATATEGAIRPSPHRVDPQAVHLWPDPPEINAAPRRRAMEFETDC